ncbi:MAG TPA: hypothetical protein VN081_03945 [Dongiaceae bacterium]|nr:hypothetical protein [Dongiaceae bacterium]
MNENRFKQAQTTAAYKRLFLGNPDGKFVLQDLASSNRVDSSTFDPDPHTAGYLQGRRDAILEIFQHINTNLVEYLTENITMEDF